MVNLTPLEDHVLILPIGEEQVTASGFILPVDEKKKPSKGEVIAVGAGKMLDNGSRAPMEVTVGDIVHFTQYSPDEIELDGKKYLVVKHSSLLAIEK